MVVGLSLVIGVEPGPAWLFSYVPLPLRGLDCAAGEGQSALEQNDLSAACRLANTYCLL